MKLKPALVAKNHKIEKLSFVFQTNPIFVIDCILQVLLTVTPIHTANHNCHFFGMKTLN